MTLPEPTRIDRSVVARAAILTVSVLTYGALFAVLHPVIGSAVGLFAAPVVVIAAWTFGAAAAMVVGAALAAIDTLLLYSIGSLAEVASLSRVAFTVGVLLFSVAVATIHKLSTDRNRNRDLLELTLQVANDGLWDWRLADDAVFFSPRWFTMLGYEEDAFPHSRESFHSLLHPDDLATVRETIARSVADRQPEFQLDFRMQHKSGTWTWILARAKVVEWETDGSPARIVGIHSDITERKRIEDDIVFFAYHNQLTGLRNRKSFYERAREIIQQAGRSNGDRFRGFIAIDINDFKAINDSYGHPVGDQVLIQVANQLGEVLRSTDYLFHIGGDDFYLILTGIKRDTDLAVVAEKIRALFARPLYVGATRIDLELSMGLCVYPRDAVDVAGLIMGMETALEESKHDGEPYRYYTSDMHQRVLENTSLVADIRRGLEAREFEVYYQPIVTRNGAVVAAEALVRWSHPQRGMVSPVHFIPAAEETGLIVTLGEQVAENVCKDLHQLSAAGIDRFHVSINLSVRQIKERSLRSTLKHLLNRYGVAGHRVTLEVTESSLVDDLGETVATLNGLRELGVRIALDDFGTGYSSLSYLKNLPIDTLKIDRSFVINLPTSAEDRAIVRSILSMCEGLGLSVVAEGVDSEEQLDVLGQHGCTTFQGYLFSRPLAYAAFREYLSHSELVESEGRGALLPSAGHAT